MTSAGPAFVYVLPTHHEDLLKLGFSRDPLARMQALHPRFYEFFDLARAFAVELDRVAEARALELAQQRRLRAHRAPAPLTALRAGGGREWFRGAWEALAPLAGEYAQLGHRVHRPLAGWVGAQLERAGPSLHEWTARLAPEEVEARGPDALHTLAQRRVLDVLDAYRAFDLPLERWLDRPLLEWHRAARRTSGLE